MGTSVTASLRRWYGKRNACFPLSHLPVGTGSIPCGHFSLLPARRCHLGYLWCLRHCRQCSESRGMPRGLLKGANMCCHDLAVCRCCSISSHLCNVLSDLQHDHSM